ncbi:MAG: hypothetical protein IPJ15_09300 [Actinomycetales bacterium]|nr:hypothetical protein [Candidatus Phosphoribacter baldrii]
MSALAAVGRTVRRVWGRAWPPSKWVADSPASRRPPMSNYIPNSDGKGGKVISSGHPGATEPPRWHLWSVSHTRVWLTLHRSGQVVAAAYLPIHLAAVLLAPRRSGVGEADEDLQ